MPTTQFIDARALLTPAQAGALDAQLAAWKTESSPWPQNAENIENETALEPKVFSKLLTDFANLLPDPNAWRNSCWKNQFKGQSLFAKDIPIALGRLLEIKKLYSFAANFTDLSESLFEKLMTDADGKDFSDIDLELVEILHETPLGEYLIWATFDETNSALDPFLPFNSDAADCCTRLGLRDPKGSTCVLLAYHSAPYRRTPPKLEMNRSTVADAAGFELYRPHTDPAKPYGMTNPTAPNPKGFSGHPEVVHKEITGQGLAFRVRLAR